MKTLLRRMAPLCLCASALTFTTTSAIAGSGSLFSSDAGLFGGAPARAQPSASMSLLQAGSGPSRARAAAVRTEPQAEVVRASTGTRRDRFTERDLDCLAQAIYHEARGESQVGQLAVANVIVNRARSGKFPSTLCGVIYQNADKGRHRCQFTFACDGRSDAPGERHAWARSAALAQEVYAEFALGDAVGAVPGSALYYHTTAVRPSWANTYSAVAQIGSHIFYSPN